MKSIGDIAQAAVARQLETPDGPPPPGRQRAVMRAEGRHQVFAQLRDLKSPFPFNEMVKALERAAEWRIDGVDSVSCSLNDGTRRSITVPLVAFDFHAL